MPFKMYYYRQIRETPETPLQALYFSTTSWEILNEEDFIALQEILQRYPRLFPEPEKNAFAVAIKTDTGFMIRFGYYDHGCGNHPAWKCFFEISLKKAQEFDAKLLQEVVDDRARKASKVLKRIPVVALGSIYDSLDTLYATE